MSARSDVLFGFQSHVGMERSENQDHCGWFEPESDDDLALKGRLAVVCDGMGGHAGGEIASHLAVETILECYRADRTGDVLEVLRSALEAANAAINTRAQERPELEHMGSTCVALVVKGDLAYLAHAGDSRCYYVHDGKLQQITKDHSLVQEMADAGLIDEADMESHPHKNVILRALGVKPDIEVELGVLPIAPGDIFCLGSDGLTGLVSKDDCLHTLREHTDAPGEAARVLVDLANKNGGPDNVTVQVLKIVSVPAPAAAAQAGGDGGEGREGRADAAEGAGTLARE